MTLHRSHVSGAGDWAKIMCRKCLDQESKSGLSQTWQSISVAGKWKIAVRDGIREGMISVSPFWLGRNHSQVELSLFAGELGKPMA